MSELLEVDPKVRAIVCSGYSNHPVMAAFRDYGFTAAMPKPYQMDDLKKAMAEVLFV